MMPAFGLKIKKVLTKKQLKRKVQFLRKRKRTIVTTNGRFDILHAGHIYLLERAKQLGDILIVGLNSDRSIKRYRNKDRPIIPERHRATLLSAIEYVDYIYVFHEINPIKFLEVVHPDVHVNSAEYGKNCVEALTIRKYGGKLVLIRKQKSLLSTSNIIEKVLRIYCPRI